MIRKFPEFLRGYILRGSLWKGKLKAEDSLSYQWANYLRDKTISGHLNCVWCHVPNESPSSVRFGAKLNALGRFSGVSDYLLGNNKGMWAIEVKTGKIKQSPYQIAFQQWCSHNQVPYALMYNMEEGIKSLKEWGLLND